VVRITLALALGQSCFHAFIASLPVALAGAGRGDGEIGVIMGTAALVPLVAAIVAGGLIDRFGGRAVFIGGTGALFAAALLIGLGVASVEGPPAPLLVARVLQGIGIAATAPAALSIVPGLVPETRLGTVLAVVGTGGNVSLALAPPLSLLLLDRYSIAAVGWAAAVAALVAVAIIWELPRPIRPAAEAAAGRARMFRPSWRPSWTGPLAISLLFVAHWGVVTAYLPQRAERVGADIGLFFTADALALLALRVPAGYLAGRIGSRGLILAGIGVTLVALALLLPRPTTALLIASGIGTGAGGALILPPIMLELSLRSGATERGSAFALYNVAFSTGIVLGSLAVAPLIGRIGFEVALAAGMAACATAGVVAALDRPRAGVAIAEGSA
jgi:MFS family permease